MKLKELCQIFRNDYLEVSSDDSDHTIMITEVGDSDYAKRFANEEVIMTGAENYIKITSWWGYSPGIESSKTKYKVADYESYDTAIFKFSVSSGASTHIYLVHKQGLPNVHDLVNQDLSKIFKYNLTTRFRTGIITPTNLFSDSDDINVTVELYSDGGYIYVMLSEYYINSFAIQNHVVSNPDLQFCDAQINQKFLEIFNRKLQDVVDKKNKKIKDQSDKITDIITDSKILSISYTNTLSVKTMCFEKNKKKYSLNMRDLNTDTIVKLIKRIGSFLADDETVSFTTNKNGDSIKEIYAVNIKYLMSNTTVKTGEDGLKYVNINRKKIFIDQSACDSLYAAGQKIGIDETEMSSWLLLALV